MRLVLIVALLLGGFLLPAHSAEWVEGSTIGVPWDNAKRPTAIFVTSLDPTASIPRIPIPPNQWVLIDLTNGPDWDVTEFGGDNVRWQPDIPEDTIAVFLSGMLIITHPGGIITCDLWANFRAPGGDLFEGSYQMQTIEAVAGSGSRSTASVMVPVVDRRFEFYWNHTQGCPSAINLSLQAYVR